MELRYAAAGEKDTQTPNWLVKAHELIESTRLYRITRTLEEIRDKDFTGTVHTKDGSVVCVMRPSSQILEIATSRDEDHGDRGVTVDISAEWDWGTDELSSIVATEKQCGDYGETKRHWSHEAGEQEIRTLPTQTVLTELKIAQASIG